MDAVRLYNDWKFRKKTDKLADELKELDQQTEEYEKKKAEYDAAVANILEDILKPDELSEYRLLPISTDQGFTILYIDAFIEVN